MDLILFGVLAGAAWFITEGQKFLQEYQIKVKNFKIDFPATGKTFYTNIIGDLTLQINNPSQLVATLSKLQLSAWYDGKMVGTLIKNEPITLQAGNINYTFKIALNTLNIFGSVAKAIDAIKSGNGVAIQLKGFGEVGKATITVNETIKLL